MAKKKIKGFKAFNADLTCRGMQYEIGKTYEMERKPILCRRGYHFCQNLSDVYRFYPMAESIRICEVEALGIVVTDERGVKSCTNKIKILREIKNPKAKTNSGNKNSGWFNSGHQNSGDYNSGDYNSGSHNSGDCNNGDWNSGNRNNGWGNTGMCNNGGYNTGDNNRGNYNSGDYNVGNWNSGNYNRGFKNCGDYNSGNYNHGCFNTEINPKIKLFNKESDWTRDDWYFSAAKWILSDMPNDKITRVFEKYMSDEEKANHPEYKTTGMYLKYSDATDEDRQAWWDGLSPENKETVLALPNFDADIFYQCTGINVNKERKE